MYIRGRVSRLYRDDGKIVVVGADTLSGSIVEVRADMVVLAMAMRPSSGLEELVKKLKIQTDANGFLAEAHPKLRPVETLSPGIFITGCAQSPKDIQDTVAQGLYFADELTRGFDPNSGTCPWLERGFYIRVSGCVAPCLERLSDSLHHQIKEHRRHFQFAWPSSLKRILSRSSRVPPDRARAPRRESA